MEDERVSGPFEGMLLGNPGVDNEVGVETEGQSGQAGARNAGENEAAPWQNKSFLRN